MRHPLAVFEGEIKVGDEKTASAEEIKLTFDYYPTVQGDSEKALSTLITPTSTNGNGNGTNGNGSHGGLTPLPIASHNPTVPSRGTDKSLVD
jgi:hypothetical protein